MDACGKGIQLVLVSVGDRFFLTVDQDWSERVYIDSFLRVPGERGISWEIEFDGELRTPEMDLG